MKHEYNVDTRILHKLERVGLDFHEVTGTLHNGGYVFDFADHSQEFPVLGYWKQISADLFPRFDLHLDIKRRPSISIHMHRQQHETAYDDEAYDKVLAELTSLKGIFAKDRCAISQLLHQLVKHPPLCMKGERYFRNAPQPGDRRGLSLRERIDPEKYAKLMESLAS